MKKASATRTDSDRRVLQADRLSCVLRILMIIQGRQLRNAKSIAEELEISERTFYRYVSVLKMAGFPCYFDNEINGYLIRKDHRFALPRLTETELIGQAVATIVTGAAGLTEAGNSNAMTQKIAASVDDDSKQLLKDVEQLVCVLGLQLADHDASSDRFRTIQQALLKQRQLLGTYSSPYENEPVSCELTPLRLCLIKQAWYLIAIPAGSDQPKTYRVPRFETLRCGDKKVAIPDDFNLHEYFGNAWAVYRGDRSYQVKIRFLPDAARIVTETNWHPTQTSTPQPDGSVILGFTVDGLEEICNWLLGWTGRAEVLEPQELRSMFVDRLQAGLRLNQ